MAKRGRIQKTNSVGHREDNITILQGSKELTFQKPKPYTQWLKITRERWETYWDSDLSQMTQLVDLPALERLFQYYDETERASRTLRKLGSKGLLSKGSTGQPRINPLIELMLKVEEKILRLENELGLTPLSRQRLGIAFGEASMSILDLQNYLDKDWDDYEDPRLIMLEDDGKPLPKVKKVDKKTGEISYEEE
tara:strand:+ start:88 stop:669 length:582 start_codon:yes stop_codon:yes gene_type:complete